MHPYWLFGSGTIASSVHVQVSQMKSEVSITPHASVRG